MNILFLISYIYFRLSFQETNFDTYRTEKGYKDQIDISRCLV
jgi:hypothetical protein